MKRRTIGKRKGFTLIEILIVVVILGILAAIVIPRLASASETASESAVKTTLKTVRNQIQLYRVHHAGALPPDIQTLVEADPIHMDRDPNETAPPGFEYIYDEATGDYTVECTAAHSNCPDDIADW